MYPTPRYSKPGSAAHVVRPPASFTRSGGGFGPSQVLALSPAAWYRRGVGQTVVTGVSQWNDQSGNGRNLLQATTTAQPALQADGSVLFDGVGHRLAVTFTLNQPETVYCLFKQVSWTLNARLCDGSVSNAMALAQSPSTPQVLQFAGANGSAVSPAVGQLCVVAAVFNNAGSLIQLNQNALLTGTAGTNNAGGITLGAQPAGNFGNVQIYEFIVYPVAHGADTVRKVVAYLMRLGGI